MPATVNVNKRTVVHAASSGMAIGFPDVCQTPAPPAPPIPIPYPNIAMSSDTSDGSSTVKCDGEKVMVQGSSFSRSSGDEAGVVGGLMSGCNMGKAEFILYSFDVKFDGKNVCRMADLMLLNKKNTPPFPEIQPPNPAFIVPDPEEQDDELESIEWIES
jgi:hypothetical protein